MSELRVVCSCPKRECPRHGDCRACRAYHLNARRPRPPRCERRPGLVRRILNRLGGG